MTDGDAAKAAALRDELLDLAWTSRADWIFHHEPLDDAIARAQEMVCWHVDTYILCEPAALLYYVEHAASTCCADVVRHSSTLADLAPCFPAC